MPTPLRLRELLERLNEADVRFVLVGGKLLDASSILTFLRTGDRTLVATDLGQVDVLQGLPQVPPFATLDEKAPNIDLKGLVIRVCSLEHLLEMKRASDRDRDRDDLMALEAGQEDGSRGGMTGGSATLSRLDSPAQAGFSLEPPASQYGNHHLRTTDRAG